MRRKITTGLCALATLTCAAALAQSEESRATMVAQQTWTDRVIGFTAEALVHLYDAERERAQLDGIKSLNDLIRGHFYYAQKDPGFSFPTLKRYRKAVEQIGKFPVAVRWLYNRRIDGVIQHMGQFASKEKAGKAGLRPKQIRQMYWAYAQIARAELTVLELAKRPLNRKNQYEGRALQLLKRLDRHTITESGFSAKVAQQRTILKSDLLVLLSHIFDQPFTEAQVETYLFGHRRKADGQLDLLLELTRDGIRRFEKASGKTTT